MKFKVCGIVHNPEQFKVEMDAVFGPSTVLMNQHSKREGTVMMHLGYNVPGINSTAVARGYLPNYVLRQFNFDIVPWY